METKLEYEHRLTDLEAQATLHAKRLDDVEKRQDDLEVLASSVSALAAREERVESDVKEIKADVKTLTEQPGKRWNDMVDKVVWAVMAAIIAFILGRVGL